MNNKRKMKKKETKSWLKKKKKKIGSHELFAQINFKLISAS
jgi:hypothetical protein